MTADADNTTATGIAQPDSVQSRRSFFKAGTGLSLGVGALAMAAPPAMAQESKGESLLDKWTRTKSAKIGIDLTFAPLRFRDASGKPAGYGVEVLTLMLKDLGVEPDYVEMPFGQMFAALAAGKFEMMGNFATILPSRALRGTFAGFPVHYETDVVYVKKGSTVERIEQLNSPEITLALHQGSSQEYTAKLMFPKAKFQSFAQAPDVANAVGTGRADASLQADLIVPRALAAFPEMRVISGVAYVDPNSFFMPHNDFKLWVWVTNWIRYQAAHHVLSEAWDRWIGEELRQKHKIPTTKVGAGGEPVTVLPS